MFRDFKKLAEVTAREEKPEFDACLLDSKAQAGSFATSLPSVPTLPYLLGLFLPQEPALLSFPPQKPFYPTTGILLFTQW